MLICHIENAETQKKKKKIMLVSWVPIFDTDNAIVFSNSHSNILLNIILMAFKILWKGWLHKLRKGLIWLEIESSSALFNYFLLLYFYYAMAQLFPILAPGLTAKSAKQFFFCLSYLINL